MSFDELREKPRPKTSGLRSDWSAEENKFRDGHQNFIQCIEVGNPVLASPRYVFDPKKCDAEPVDGKQVRGEIPKKSPTVQDQPASTVELADVRGPNVASSTIQPARPLHQEYVLSTPNSDPFDSDPFEEKNSLNKGNESASKSNKPENYAKKSDDDFFDTLVEQSKKPAAAPAPMKKAAADVLDDLFSSPPKVTSSPASAASPSPPPPTPAVATTAPATETAQPAKPAAPTSAPAGAAHGDNISKEKTPSIQGADVFGIEPLHLEGFDLERFKKISDTAAEMLEGCPNIDLDFLMNSLGEFSICLDLDHLRENPQLLTDRLLEIQSKRDSLHAQILRLTPIKISMKSAAEYIETAGLDCSSASSKEKRLAQIMSLIPKFWVRVSRVNRTSANVESTFEHLAAQYECISRLITGYQIKLKIGEITRGAEPYTERPSIPFDPPYRISPPQSPPPTPKAPPTASVNDDFLNRSMSQPATGSGAGTKFKNLESFNSGVKPAKKTTEQNLGTTEDAW